jgi:hypothetical protein
MKKIHCAICTTLVSVMDIPSPESVKAMLKEASNTKQDAKTAIILASAQTLLPMLPPEAYDLLTSAMPQYCPACVVEHNIGQLAEDVSNGRTQQESGTAGLTDGSSNAGDATRAARGSDSGEPSGGSGAGSARG